MREKRERKWGLTGSCGLYPIFAKDPSFERAKRGEKERVREKRERKWGLTGSCGLYPIFAKDPSFERARRGEKERE
ncbi:MAG: hypothetical protein GXY62_11150 [Thermotogaceae bacterium]|nr:hypothetical protein [Thermotogaceae bacterium]